jgi:hypothetical protein
MILGMSFATFTTIHVVISLLAILAGLLVLGGMLQGADAGVWVPLFLVTSVLTSTTGFPIPPPGFDPPRAIGLVLLALIAVATAAFYVFRLAGAWRVVYIFTATAALYLNCFVAVVQAFQKVPFLHALAPTQQEPPFAAAQVILLGLFLAAGVVARKRYRVGRLAAG